MKKLAALALIFSTVFLAASAARAADEHPEIPLWPNSAPGSEGKTGVEHPNPPTGRRDYAMLTGIHKPSITAYLPPKDKATGIGVIVIPGGLHEFLAIDTEGYNAGQWLSDHGIAAFVLKYRLAKEPNSTYTIEGQEIPDVQRAIRLVRSRAADWNVDAARVGIMGFSAGGELAFRTAMANAGTNDAADNPIDRLSARPAFQVLVYPTNLKLFEPVAGLPPAFLVCGANDSTEISEGMAEAYLKLKRLKVPAELHIYAGVGHGFAVKPGHHAAVDKWPERFVDWLVERRLIKPAQP